MSYGNYPSLDNIKKILVVKLRHLGDVVLMTPVIENLRLRFPQAQIDAMLYSEGAPLLQVDHLYLCKRGNKSLSHYFKIRKERYDLVINLTEGDRGALAALFSKAPVRVGIKPNKRGFLFKEKCFTHLVKQTKKPRHQVERDLDALRVIGIFPTLGQRNLSLPSFGKKEGEYILIHPASRWRFKCYPAEKMARVVTLLQKEGHQVAMSCGPSREDREVLDAILKRCTPDQLYPGNLTLQEFSALIEGAKALLTVDTVALHIASAYSVPTVALFGPTSEQEWGPWQNPHATVLTKTLPCRPCGQDGCAGSKFSDCLFQLEEERVVKTLIKLQEKALLEEKCFDHNIDLEQLFN